MKRISLLLIVLVFMGANIVHAQDDVPVTQMIPDTAKLAYNEISKRGGIVVFPSNDQSQQQQKIDEFECYQWAFDQTGIDPLNLPKVEVEVQSGPTGGAVRGAARGAAAGAAIGAIAGDAGEGAAIGAAAGGMRGVRQGRRAQAQQNQQAEAEAKQAEEDLKNQFKKAWMACMEGKGYTVK